MMWNVLFALAVFFPVLAIACGVALSADVAESEPQPEA